jgi:hypothetical protein
MARIALRESASAFSHSAAPSPPTANAPAASGEWEKRPQAYFLGIVSLARIIKWELGPAGAFDRPTPEEIMNKHEERVGPEGRRLFEQFLEKVNRLQLRQQQEQRQQQPHTVSPSGGGDAIERALAVAAATNAQIKSSCEQQPPSGSAQDRRATKPLSR